MLPIWLIVSSTDENNSDTGYSSADGDAALSLIWRISAPLGTFLSG